MSLLQSATLPASTRTTCPYCGVGCGVLATLEASGRVDIAGDGEHPANRGRLCVKGSALGETLGLEGRLLHPKLRAADGTVSDTSWDEALRRVALGFQKIIAEHGPDAVAFYVSGQLLTEDYYVANKLMKGYLGSANIDTNSRLCMSSAVAGHKRAFGEDVVPGCYEDFEVADLVVLVGSNTAWCHPVLFQRLTAAKKARPELQIVVIDPRHTATCEVADLHLPVAPGTDVHLFNGLLAYLHEHGVMDTAFVEAHTSGATEAVAVAQQTGGSVSHVARACKLSEEKLRQFYALWARTQKVVTAFSMGVNQSNAGTDKVNSIINCHLYTGRIGKPGASPFSITGQPNAMGGREVGGLANMLAAHLEIAEPTHRALVQQFWQSPVMADHPGLKAVDLFEAIHAGTVKAVWIMGTNPVVSMPNADRVKAALQGCELVVVSEVMAATDTADLAHILLPALAWGEKDGSVTNSDRTLSRQRQFLAAPGQARADWWALSQVAQRMGFAGFEYESAAQIFDEHARLTAHDNTPAQAPRRLTLAGLVGMTPAQYEALTPQQWPVPVAGHTGEVQRQYGNGQFSTPDGRARLLPLLPRLPSNKPDDEYPLVLNTGRMRDHWHTMSRTGKSPRLAVHASEPTVEVHPHDALLWGVKDGQLARVATRWGSVVLRVRTSTGVARRQLFVPIHWNGQTASDARVGRLVNPVVDPVSGEPEFKHTPAMLEPFYSDWHGFILSRETLPMQAADRPALAWWTRIQGEQFHRYEMTGRGRSSEWAAGWSQRARQLLGAPDEADWLETQDPSEGLYRAAWVGDDGRLIACLFASQRPEDLPTRQWLAGLFVLPELDELDRMALLTGSGLTPQVDSGPTICACFGVGQKTIEAAIRSGCRSAEALGSQLKCGTNCGSCVPELKQLIAASGA